MSLEDFLAGAASAGTPHGSKKCSICTNEKLAEEVAEFVRRRHTGEVSHSVHWIWVNYFAPVYSIGSCNTLRNHIRLHLGVDL